MLHQNGGRLSLPCRPPPVVGIGTFPVRAGAVAADG
jgi:hypothetical protein